MPRENRKRGKKHKKKAEDDDGALQPQEPEPQYEEETEAIETGPSWIVSARQNAVDLNAPFGFVDAEVKAYFRTVDVQIREWQETRPETEGDEDMDPNEDRRLFFVAALTEMSGKEKQLATDPDCSTILERMVHSMDDFARRVFMDSISGSLEQLSKHRFSSHVCQTLLNVGSETVSREAGGIYPPTPDSQEDVGELRTFTQLTLDACEELLPSLSSFIMDPFASHIVRALLLLLAPDVLSGVAETGKTNNKVRSKKSAAYKARQGPMKSVFVEGGDQKQVSTTRRVPKEFRKVATRIVSAMRDSLGENEVRALAANQVASPVLQILLELEAAYGMADSPGSLTDHALVGLISVIHADPKADVPESDYLTTLLRDPTASHMLETLVQRSPDRAFNVLWRTYFLGKLSKLSVHPVANFVVAKAVERLDVEQLRSAVEEIHNVGGKIVKNARVGVLRALVDRASALQADAQDIVELLLAAFELDTDEKKQLFVPCVMRLKTYDEYQRALASASKDVEEAAEEDHRHKRRKTEDPLEPKTQGAVLLQAMLRLPAPHNDVVLNSIHALPLDALTQLGQHPTSSHVLDALLTSPTVPPKSRRTLLSAFLGHYHVLADDRVGSRVAERCWAAADPYLRERIARATSQHEHALAGSFFGKFFVRQMALHVLRRDPERWRSMQVESKAAAAAIAAPAQNVKAEAKAPAKPAAAAPAAEPDAEEDEQETARVKSKGKRKAQPQDEIDAVFDATLGKKVKKAELAAPDEDASAKSKSKDKDRDADGRKSEKKKGKRKRDGEEGGANAGLEDVLGAIRAAPKEDKGQKKRKRGH